MELTNRAIAALAAIACLLALLAGVIHFSPKQHKPQPESKKAELVIRPTVTLKESAAPELQGPVTITLHRQTASRTVKLTCEMFSAEQTFSRRAAVFENVPGDGTCQLGLPGTQRTHLPVFPGDELECRVVGPDTRCVGGAAEHLGGTVVVRTDVAAMVFLDGQPQGATPWHSREPVSIGNHHLELRLEDETRITWQLVVPATSTLDVYFPIRGVRPDLAPLATPGTRTELALDDTKDPR